MKEENGEVKDKTGVILGVVALVIFVALALYYFVQNYKENKVGEGVSIQKYNTMQKRVDYLYYENIVKNQIIFDLVIKGKLDSSFVLSVANHVPEFIFNNKVLPDSLPDKNLLALKLNSVYADWLESIPFMFMDMKHDSAWVLQSDTYKSSMEMVNELRKRKQQ
jgi:hypothetical protein